MSNRLTISLRALAANYATLVDHAQRGGAQHEVAAVVKADGYGLGATRIARALAAAGCTEYFVATLAEGVRLRSSLPQASIYVLEGVLPNGAQALLDHKLTPVLNSLHQAQLWAAQAPAAVHIDTGMQRLGMTAEQAGQLLGSGKITTLLLMTHLARADEPEHAFNAQQINTFLQACHALRAAHGDKVPARLSICNSAGILGSLMESPPKGVSLLGRGGVALYGGNPFARRGNPMQPVVALHARVLQVRDVAVAVPVGYGGTYQTDAEKRIATVACGYADGIPRLLSNCGTVWLHGQRCPIVGRVSMDMLHVDVTGITDVDERSWVEVLGIHVGVDEIAGHAQTISYEVLTGLRARGELVYTDDFLSG